MPVEDPIRSQQLQSEDEFTQQFEFVTLVFLKVEGRKFGNMEYFDVLFYKNGISFQIQDFYDVIITS